MGDPFSHLDLLIHNAIAKHPYMAQALQMSHQVLLDEYRSMEQGFSAPPWAGTPAQQRETQDLSCLPPPSEEAINVYELLHKIILAFSTLPQDEETTKESYETILSLFVNKKHIDRFIQFFSESRFVAIPPDFKEMMERCFPAIWARLERVDPEKKINIFDRMPYKEAFGHLRNLMDAIQPEFVRGRGAPQGATQPSDAPPPMMNPFLHYQPQPVMRTPQQQLFDMGQFQPQNIFSNGLPYAMAFMQGMMAQGSPPAPSFAAPMFNPLPRAASIMPPSRAETRPISIAPTPSPPARLQMGQHFDHPDPSLTARDPSLYGGASPWLRNDWEGSRDNKSHNWSGGETRWEASNEDNSIVERGQRAGGEEGSGAAGEGVKSSFDSSASKFKKPMGSGIPPRPIKQDSEEFRRPSTPNTSSIRSSRSQNSTGGAEPSVKRQKPVAAGVSVKNEHYVPLPSGDPSDPAPLFSAAIPDVNVSPAPRRSLRQAAKNQTVQREMEEKAPIKPKRSCTVTSRSSKNDVKVDVKELKRFASVQGRRDVQQEPDDHLQSDVIVLPSTGQKKTVKRERGRPTQKKPPRKRVCFSVDEKHSKVPSEEDQGNTKKSKGSSSDVVVLGSDQSSSPSHDLPLAPTPRRPGLRQRGRTVDYRMKHLSPSPEVTRKRGRASSGCEEPPGLAKVHKSAAPRSTAVPTKPPRAAKRSKSTAVSSSSSVEIICQKVRGVKRGRKALPPPSAEEVKVETDEIGPDSTQLLQNREEDNIFLSVREDSKEENEELALLTIQQGGGGCFKDQPQLNVPVKKEVYDSRKEVPYPKVVQRDSQISLVSLISEADNEHLESPDLQKTTGGVQELKAESLLTEDTDCYWSNDVEGTNELGDAGEFQEYDEETIRNMTYKPELSYQEGVLVPSAGKKRTVGKSMSDPQVYTGMKQGAPDEVAKTAKVFAPFVQPYLFSSAEGKEGVEQAEDRGKRNDPDSSVPKKKIKMTVSEEHKETSNERLDEEEKPPVMDEEEETKPPEKKVRFSQVIQISQGGQENEEEVKREAEEEDGGEKEGVPYDDGRIDEMEEGEIRTDDDEDYKPEVEQPKPRRSSSYSRHHRDDHRSSSGSSRRRSRSRRESSMESVREDHRYRFRSNSTARGGISRIRGSTVASSYTPSFSRVRIALFIYSDAKTIRMPRIPEPYYMRDTDTICPTFYCAAVLYITRDERLVEKKLLIPDDLPRAFIVCAAGGKAKLHLPAERKLRPDSLLRNAFALLALRLTNSVDY